MRQIYTREYLTCAVLLGNLVGVSLGESQQAIPLRAEPLPAGTFSDWFLERPEPLVHFGPLFESPGTMGIAISHDGKYLVMGTVQEEILHDNDYPHYPLYVAVYNAQRRCYTHVVRFAHEFRSPHGYPNVQISPDDTRVAIAWLDGVILCEFEKEKGKLKPLWEKRIVPRPALGKRMQAVHNPKCAFTPDGKYVVAVVDIQPIVKLETATGNLNRRIDPKDVVPEDLRKASIWCDYAIRRDGSEVAMVLDSGDLNNPNRAAIKQGILLVDAKSKNTRFLQLKNLSWHYVRCCFHPTRKLLAAAYLDEGRKQTLTRSLWVIRWDYENLASEEKFIGTQWQTCCSQIAFCPSGDFLILTLEPKWLSDPNLLIFDSNTLKVRAAYRVRPGLVYNFRFTPKGDSLVLISSDGHLVHIHWPKLVQHILALK